MSNRGRPRVVVVGAGAAGTMAAIFAASNRADTLLLERTADGGRKILISGGGRCNVLPARFEPSRFVTDSSSHSLRRILQSWPLAEQRTFFENQLALPLMEEPDTGKLFPVSERARDVRDTLFAHARRQGARILTGTLVTDLRRDGDYWIVQTTDASIEADAVVLATGGLSVPKTGSDGRGLEIAERLDHTLHPRYPALTPLINDDMDGSFSELAGISLPVVITASSERHRSSSTGGFLFTHRGYSGPAVLDISHVATRSANGQGRPARITVRWSPLGEPEWNDVLKPDGRRTVLGALDGRLPRRLAETLVRRAGIQPDQLLSHLTRAGRLALIASLVRTELPWTGDEGYKKAEVTGGGVSLAEVDPGTLESRRHKGLFFCGEMLDAFGPIGGYNFLWAWTTGRAAGTAAARTDRGRSDVMLGNRASLNSDRRRPR